MKKHFHLNPENKLSADSYCRYWEKRKNRFLLPFSTVSAISTITLRWKTTNNDQFQHSANIYCKFVDFSIEFK